MADPTTNAPATTNAAPPPDVSGASQPGAAAMTPAPAAAVTPDNNAAAVQAQMAPYQANEKAAYENAANLAKPDAPAPPPPHARLLGMIQGLSLGLSAAATSIATKGAEGGAKEVIQVQQQQAEAKQRAAEAALQQKNTKIQQQLMVGDTNHKLAQNVLMMSNLKNEMEKSDLEVSGLKQGQSIQAADFAAQHGGMSPDDFNKALSGNAPAGAAGSSSFFTANAKQQLDAATKVLGADDPYVKELQTTLQNPNATPKDLWQASTRLQTQRDLQEKATEDTLKKQSVEKGARPSDLDDATGRVTQAAQAYKASPTPENHRALSDAKAAQQIFFNEDRQKKQMEQDVQAGDPEVLGQALVSGAYAPSQLLSARSMSKPVYTKVIAAADQAAKAAGVPEILDAQGKPTGHYFNATKAESQYEFSKNIQTQNVMTKIRTLNEPGGDLDILRDAVTNLPKMDNNTINAVFNAGATEFGSPAATTYHTALYNMASLLATVQTGGIPTEGEIQTQLSLMKDKFSKGQLAGALETNRKDIAARGSAIIGDNPYLRNAFPDLVKPAQTATPQSHVFDSKAWSAANPGKDVNAAIAAAKQQGYEVK